MIQSASPRILLHKVYLRLFAASGLAHRGGAGKNRAALPLEAALRLNTLMVSGPHMAKTAELPPTISVDDWDSLFVAVEERLRQAVEERRDTLPDLPAHSAELSASQVQAIVLDCVDSLNLLHTALKQERSRRPAP